MATIHELSNMRKTADKPMNSESFRVWYKKYLVLGRNKKNTVTEEELAVALDAECDAVEELLPEAGLETLHEGNDCKLCADDGDVRRAELFATTDLGHMRETQDEKNLFGTKHGYAVPVHISCCKRCKKNYNMVAYIPTFTGLILTIIAFLTLSDRNVREPLMAVFTALPIVVFLASVGVSMLVCALLRRFLLDKLGQKTKFDIFEIEKLHYMKVGGWLNLFDETNYSKLMFADKLPDYYNDAENKEVDTFKSGTDYESEPVTAFEQPEYSEQLNAQDENKAEEEPKPEKEEQTDEEPKFEDKL